MDRLFIAVITSAVLLLLTSASLLMYRTGKSAAETVGWHKDWRRLARSGEILQRSLSAREAALLVYLAELLLQLCDLFFRSLLELLIDNKHQESPIFHDLHCQFNALVLATHDSDSDVFLIRRRNHVFVQR